MENNPQKKFPKEATVEEDVILVDKPKGPSSFRALQLLRNQYDIFKKVKIGHAGTLDPNATGLLIVGVGDGTKKLEKYVGLNKTYLAEVLLGTRTDTGDVLGEVVESQDILEADYSEDKITEIVGNFVGKKILPVPIYSATKQGGETLYKKARAGKKLIQPQREMEIFSSSFINSLLRDSKVYVELELEVSSGTYIRSIAEEVGKQLGLPATLSNLRRTKVGEYDVGDAIKISPSH